MNASDLMTKAVQSCIASDNLQRAAQLMWDGDYGVVPVVDGDNRVVGMVTDRDIAMAAYLQGKPLWQIPVSSVMANRVHGVQEDAPVQDVDMTMRRVRVRRIPVLDGDGRLRGILSMNDLVRHVRQKSNSISGDALVETLAAIGEKRAVAVARVKQRESIVGLLTDAEVAKVSRAEETTQLVEGDEYVDLEDLDSGVHRVQERSRLEPGHALPRSAVSEATWANVVRAIAS